MRSSHQGLAALTVRTYSYSELVAVSGATRKEVSDWVARRIITAELSPGSGKHRQYSWQSVVEAFAAKVMSLDETIKGGPRRGLAIPQFTFKHLLQDKLSGPTGMLLSFLVQTIYQLPGDFETAFVTTRLVGQCGQAAMLETI